MSPSAWDSLLPPFHRTRNKNCSRTSLGHFSFPICFSTFLSLSRSSCSPSPVVSTGTGWKQGSNRSDRVNHLLMSSVPGVDGEALPCRELPWAGGNLSLGELDLPCFIVCAGSAHAFLVIIPKGPAEKPRSSSCTEDSPARLKSRRLRHR